jgi:hypothetical protein
VLKMVKSIEFRADKKSNYLGLKSPSNLVQEILKCSENRPF